MPNEFDEVKRELIAEREAYRKDAEKGAPQRRSAVAEDALAKFFKQKGYTKSRVKFQ